MRKKLTKLLSLTLLSFTLAVGFTYSAVQAGSPQELACDGAGGYWAGGECVNPSDQGGTLTDLIVSVINALLYIIGIVSVVMIIIGGFRYVVAQGDSGQLTLAKNTIMYAVIGLLVAITAFAIVNFILGRF